jgi:8-hydroxy-5-deazaflavin:NADPH oxidoreductase
VTARADAVSKQEQLMRIGFIGAGTLTKTFGRHLINAGHEIVLSNSRGPETLAGLVADLGPGATAGTKKQAAESDVVILATNWVNVPEALKDIDWHGRILIDATNAHMDPKPDISREGVNRSIAALNGRTSSEMVAELAAGARLVKSISNMPMAWIQDFSSHKPKTVIFTSGNDGEAKKIVINLIDSIGFVAIDLGSLAEGGAMHQVGAPLSGLDLHFVRRLR